MKFKFGDKVTYCPLNKKGRVKYGYPRKAVCITDEYDNDVVGVAIFHGSIYHEIVWSGELKKGWKRLKKVNPK